MPAGDVYELTLDQIVADQSISNVHHFVQIGSDGTGDPRAAVAAVWASFYNTPYLNLLSTGVTVFQSRTRRVLPTQTQQFTASIFLSGAVVGVPLPTNQCAIMREYATPSGRKGVGHVKLPGVDNVFVNEGRINGSYRGLIELFGDIFEADRTDSGSGFAFRSCVLGTDGVARQIQLTRATSRIKQVRSRTVGVGE